MFEHKDNSSGIYEGNEPYLFISYSHKDTYALERVKTIFDDSKIRYWYDNGLHSGDDWNLIIANRLRNASVCLLLLSPNSASSPPCPDATISMAYCTDCSVNSSVLPESSLRFPTTIA